MYFTFSQDGWKKRVFPPLKIALDVAGGGGASSAATDGRSAGSKVATPVDESHSLRVIFSGGRFKHCEGRMKSEQRRRSRRVEVK